MLRIACKILLLSCLLLPACATSDDGKPINFSLTAQQNYEKGLADLKDENYAEALRYFTYVKQKFPFSKYAALAELAAADTEFERGSYQEAIDAYKSFLRLHPKHEKVAEGYVSFRIAEAHVKQMPDDWFLIPPSYEKDQATVMDALHELNNLVDRFPNSKYIKPAQEYRRAVMAASSTMRSSWRASIWTAAIPRAPSCASKRRCAATRTRGATPSCCSPWARRSSKWASQPVPSRPFCASRWTMPRPSRSSAPSCSSTSSNAMTATSPRMNRPTADRVLETPLKTALR